MTHVNDMETWDHNVKICLCLWKPLTTSGLKSWAGSNEAMLYSQCIGDLSVCSGLNKIHSDDVQFSTRLAGARSCGWIQWWKCFRPLKRWLSLAELPRELCPSPENRNTLVRLGSHVCRLWVNSLGGWFWERLRHTRSIPASNPLLCYHLPQRPFFYGGRWRGPSCPCRRCREGCRCGSSWH